MSRRIATDQGGKRGPQSSRVGFERRDDDRPGSSHNNIQTGGGMPAGMPGFPMNFNFANGMPMMPPGFAMPFPSQQQGSKP